MDMNILTAWILDVSNEFRKKKRYINERVCVIPPPYYIDWFEKYYSNAPLNRHEGPFFLQCMNGIQGIRPAGRQCNRLLGAVVTRMKYRKIKIDHAIYIKVFSDGKVSYLTVYTDDVLNTTNNKKEYP